jgi:glycosyltransferase involved in cell wall biosynthesis
MAYQVKKPIAIIIPGGIGTGRNNLGVPVLENLVKLLARDFNVTVFSLFKVNDDYLAEGFDLVSISSRNFIVKSILLLFSFSKRHRKKKFRLVHGFWTLPSGILALVIARIFGLKSIVSVLGGDAVSLPEIDYGELRKWFPRKLILWTLSHADEVTVLTQYLQDNLKKFGIRRDMRVIPWGIDHTLFSYKPKSLGSTIQFLHIANLSPVKDQETLLRAFKIIGNNRASRLSIIGDGSKKNELTNIVNELELQKNVVFVSPVPYRELPQYYHQADVLLHTSLSEGQSEVVTEAMSAGVVVCGTSVGLMYDLPACCVSVPARDYKKLADEVITLLGDSDKFEMLRSNALQWTSTHTIFWTCNEIKKLYDE